MSAKFPRGGGGSRTFFSSKSIRNSDDIHTIRSNIDSITIIFFHRPLWNSLPVEERQHNTLSSFKTFLLKSSSICSNLLFLWFQESTNPSCTITYRLQFFKYGPLSYKYYWTPNVSMLKHQRYTALFLSLQILLGTLQHAFECLYNLPESFPGILLLGSSTISFEANIAILEQVNKYILDTKLFT